MMQNDRILVLHACRAALRAVEAALRDEGVELNSERDGVDWPALAAGLHEAAQDVFGALRAPVPRPRDREQLPAFPVTIRELRRLLTLYGDNDAQDHP